MSSPSGGCIDWQHSQRNAGNLLPQGSSPDSSGWRPLGFRRGHDRRGRGHDAGHAADDFTEAVGQAALRSEDTAEQWHQLAQATHAAGRYEDAVDASQRAAELLDPQSEARDQANYLLADSYRHLGDHRAALREYRRLADGGGALAAQAFVAGTALLEHLGISDWPV